MSRLPWRPRKSDAYAACERASGRCACKELATNPCDAWRMYLRSCAVMNLDTVTAEVERIQSNRARNTFFVHPCQFTHPHPRDQKEKT